MSESDPFKINNVRLQQTPNFTPSGVKQTYLLTFMVGDHGPFTKQFDGSTFSPDAAKAEMARQQADLMALVG